MHLTRKIKTFAITAFLALTAASASAQDLLARQAPIDKKMKAVDTLALRDLINKEQMGSPSAQLYKEWSNKSPNFPTHS